LLIVIKFALTAFALQLALFSLLIELYLAVS